MTTRMYYLVTALLLIATMVSAQHYKGYCPPKTAVYSVPYVAPVYSAAVAYPTYSGWTWSSWATDDGYWIKQRWVTYSATDRKLEDDGWLYLKIGDNYTRAYLKAQYGVTSLGNVKYGYDIFKYSAAQVVGPKVAVYLPPTHIPAQELPSPANVASILGDPDTHNDIDHADSDRAELLRIQSSSRISEARIKLQSDERAMRHELARQVQTDNQVLSVAAELREFAAARAQQASVGNLSNGDASLIPIKNQQVSQILATKCISCHGPSKQLGNLDLRNADAFTYKMWAKLIRLADSGDMPRDGLPKVTKAEIAILEQMLD